MSWGSDGPLTGPGAGTAAGERRPSVPASGRKVRSAGVVVYCYAGLLVAFAVMCVVGAIAAYQSGSEPSPPDGGGPENFGVVVAFVLVGIALVAGVAGILGLLLAAFLRRESRFAMWLTVLLGGIVVVLGAVAGVRALTAGEAGTALFWLGSAGVFVVPVGLVGPAAFRGRRSSSGPGADPAERHEPAH